MYWCFHGESVTFEFYASGQEKPLALIREWGTAFAGGYLCPLMVNLRVQ